MTPAPITKTLDQRAAEKLGMIPEQVGVYRGEWEKTPLSAVVKALITCRLEDALNEKLAKLRRCDPEETKGLQGAADALEMAIATVNSRLV